MDKVKLYYDEMESPVGPLLIVSNGEKVVRIEFGTLTDLNKKIEKWAHRYFENPIFVHQADQVQQAKEELHDYFHAKRRHFTIDFEFYGTDFQKNVWQALWNTIAYGETKTYKDIAEAVGNPKSVRAVGGAVNKNPFSIVVPCHRVIGSNGKMVGYNGGLDKKEYLLAHEAN
ncbi:methylated-DNA--[protein]-cysteine S-methyltransferase [Virgibacillus sp. C22-A2]|uniref:Methylated-DNA--protein-cysteine methyltransferase n=1 Tax=Virgibacillus tibetensis TaxID=3042313 RepID=A0ABU6KF02_9BACI|nr:methylated-DNA--[protein]-cysteine S-methyltransferase [Virgibacillus sp. C22-A2]